MKVRLTAVTPLHIGGREGALNPLEFVLFEGRCYIVSETKLTTALQQTDKIDIFCNWVTGCSRPSLRDFLRDQDGLIDRNRIWRDAASASGTINNMAQRAAAPVLMGNEGDVVCDIDLLIFDE